MEMKHIKTLTYRDILKAAREKYMNEFLSWGKCYFESLDSDPPVDYSIEEHMYKWCSQILDEINAEIESAK